LSAQSSEGDKARRGAWYGADTSEIAFREKAKIISGSEGRNVGDDLVWQIEKVHDLRYPGTRNTHIYGHFGHGEGVVGIKHASPFQGDLNRTSDGLNVNFVCPATAIQFG